MSVKWKLNKLRNIIDEKGYMIASIGSQNVRDARLIAAAPEMYEILSDLTKELRAYDPEEDLYSLMIEAEQLLARIDGEETSNDNK